MSKPIQDKDLARATLRLLGVDSIKILNGSTNVVEGDIYLYNDKFYKCIKNGNVNLPNEDNFIEIGFSRGVDVGAIKKFIVEGLKNTRI